MTPSTIYDVIIIGAGPAGLALANHLKHLNILILEKGQVGSSWANMPDNLNLITSWKSNFLRREDRNYFPSNKPQSANEFLGYLNYLAEGIDISVNSEVTAVNKVDNEFVITTTKSELVAKFVVNCTGYFNNPFVPSFENINSTIPMIHFKNYTNAKQFESSNRILIVGKRLSSGQVIDELHRKGKDLSLSVRGDIKYGADGLGLKISLFFLPVIDWFLSFILKNSKLEVNMSKKVKTFIDKHVTIYPSIKSIEGSEVTFVDDQKALFDAIILTTGFQETTGYLDQKTERTKLESNTDKGMFFLGYEGQINFKSRFLRGIRDDSLILANIIKERLNGSL